jgi:hypothetical protein
MLYDAVHIRIRILFCGGTDNPHLRGTLASYTFLHLYPRTRKSYKPSSVITDITVANSYIPESDSLIRSTTDHPLHPLYIWTDNAFNSVTWRRDS